ncbi:MULTISPECIES: DUF2089 family protein [Allobacillus]|uniref:DUF2089 domain-containing protein n=2 Tax=Allobacillus TaxID=1400133 RepID=A0A556PGH0_9BACI|nr:MULTISPECIES: DUF2089 family protein [Allobacillus]MBU6079742.1 DUF2089 domain-containing protein [Allobacillus halotolerans]TSJ63497.1 DUF2089 domain-containing protein [Allobacillus salarius]TSJ68007.1 DUF2089 domain-containing protein [Allobacillus sp. SKP2-8]
MDIRDVPSWILSLDQEDVEFIKKFVMNSGSLKEIAKVYEVSYPTVRIKLDRLIEKIKLNDAAENEEFIQFIKKLSIDDRINLEEAKLIIEKYKKEKER